jgi:hypothetical protein
MEENKNHGILNVEKVKRKKRKNRNDKVLKNH